MKRRRLNKKGKAVLMAAVFLVGIGVGIGLSGHSTAQNNFQDLGFVAMRTVPMDVNLQKHVYETARQYGLDWTLLMAVIQQESQFDIYAKSDAGDFGLMQINRINHPTLSVTLGIHDFMDPYDNVRAGAYMLRDLFDKYGDVNKVLMAYHMGESGAASLWEQGIYETGYSRSVLRIRQELLANQGVSV